MAGKVMALTEIRRRNVVDVDSEGRRVLSSDHAQRREGDDSSEGTHRGGGCGGWWMD